MLYCLSRCKCLLIKNEVKSQPCVEYLRPTTFLILVRYFCICVKYPTRLKRRKFLSWDSNRVEYRIGARYRSIGAKRRAHPPRPIFFCHRCCRRRRTVASRACVRASEQGLPRTIRRYREYRQIIDISLGCRLSPSSYGIMTSR